MEITAIEKRRAHLMQIEFSEGEAALLDSKTVAENGLYVGQQLTAEELQKLKDLSDYTRALSRAVWYIERGALSEKALRDKLIRAGFPPAVCEKCTARLCELGLIDDTALAERLAEQLTAANISQRAALSRMVAKGIPRDVAAAALENTECDAESQIRAVIDKKYKTRLGSPEQVRKVFAALLRLGFSYGDVRAVLKAYTEELEYSEE
jgi:SOS response regulatory protein OraA/RecX